jgi:general secretion pathway protein H
MRQRGFTLVELLVVLVILALVLALVPAFLAGSQGTAELDTRAHELAAKLREARSLAIRDGRTAAFVVDGAEGLYGIVAGGVELRRLPAGWHVAILDAADEPVEPRRGIIRFFADGSSTGGIVAILRGDRRSDVEVEWLTGRVSIAR